MLGLKLNHVSKRGPRLLEGKQLKLEGYTAAHLDPALTQIHIRAHRAALICLFIYHMICLLSFWRHVNRNHHITSFFRTKIAYYILLRFTHKQDTGLNISPGLYDHWWPSVRKTQIISSNCINLVHLHSIQYRGNGYPGVVANESQ